MRVATCYVYVDRRIRLGWTGFPPQQASRPTQEDWGVAPSSSGSVPYPRGGYRPQACPGRGPQPGCGLAEATHASVEADAAEHRASRGFSTDQSQWWASRTPPSGTLRQAQLPSTRQGTVCEVVERRLHQALRDVDLALGDAPKGFDEIGPATGLSHVSRCSCFKSRDQHRATVRSHEDDPSAGHQLADQARSGQPPPVERGGCEHHHLWLIARGVGNQVGSVTRELHHPKSGVPLQRPSYCAAEQSVPVGQENPDLREFFRAGRHALPAGEAPTLARAEGPRMR